MKRPQSVSVIGTFLYQVEKLPTAKAVENPDLILYDQDTKRPPRRDQFRCRDVPAVPWPNNEPPPIGGNSNVTRSQPAAAGKDFNNASPQRERSVRETPSTSKRRNHGHIL
jgi:hypothetical protein